MSAPSEVDAEFLPLSRGERERGGRVASAEELGRFHSTPRTEIVVLAAHVFPNERAVHSFPRVIVVSHDTHRGHAHCLRLDADATDRLIPVLEQAARAARRLQHGSPAPAEEL